jgi:hypothetical protein
VLQKILKALSYLLFLSKNKKEGGKWHFYVPPKFMLTQSVLQAEKVSEKLTKNKRDFQYTVPAAE